LDFYFEHEDFEVSKVFVKPDFPEKPLSIPYLGFPVLKPICFFCLLTFPLPFYGSLEAALRLSLDCIFIYMIENGWFMSLHENCWKHDAVLGNRCF